MSHNPGYISPHKSLILDGDSALHEKIVVRFIGDKEVKLTLSKKKALFLARCLMDCVSDSIETDQISGFSLSSCQRGKTISNDSIFSVTINPRC